jgi:hypothetical protein
VNMQKTNKPNKKLISYITPAGGIGFRWNFEPPGAQGTAQTKKISEEVKKLKELDKIYLEAWRSITSINK